MNLPMPQSPNPKKLATQPKTSSKKPTTPNPTARSSPKPTAKSAPTGKKSGSTTSPQPSSPPSSKGKSGSSAKSSSSRPKGGKSSSSSSSSSQKAPQAVGVGAPPTTPQQKQAMLQAQRANNLPAQEPPAPPDVKSARKYQTSILKVRQSRETRGKLPSAPRDTDAGYGAGFFPAQSPML